MFGISLILICVCFVDFITCPDRCLTPDNKSAVCIPIRNCKPMTDILGNTPRPFSNNLINTLRDYKCSTEGSPLSVCCPDSPIKISISNKDHEILEELEPNGLPVECGISNSDRLLRNTATLLEYPWTTLISYKTKSGPKFKCGGTIINDKYILTAAHCIANKTNKLLGVRVGEHNTLTEIDCEGENNSKVCNNPVQNLLIEKVIVHPSYDPTTLSNDIGLIKVLNMNSTAENAQPICLPIQGVRNTSVPYATISGFGSFNNGTIKSKLLKDDVVIIKPEDCQKAYANRSIHITDKHVCAKVKKENTACPGNYGDPLQYFEFLNDDVRLIQYGIISFGHRSCGKSEDPIVFTKIAPFLDWIFDSIQN